MHEYKCKFRGKKGFLYTEDARLVFEPKKESAEKTIIPYENITGVNRKSLTEKIVFWVLSPIIVIGYVLLILLAIMTRQTTMTSNSGKTKITTKDGEAFVFYVRKKARFVRELRGKTGK
jgi:hypothetical protein